LAPIHQRYRQTGQQCDSIGRTVLQTVAQKLLTSKHTYNFAPQPEPSHIPTLFGKILATERVRSSRSLCSNVAFLGVRSRVDMISQHIHGRLNVFSRSCDWPYTREVLFVRVRSCARRLLKPPNGNLQASSRRSTNSSFLAN